MTRIATVALLLLVGCMKQSEDDRQGPYVPVVFSIEPVGVDSARGVACYKMGYGLSCVKVR